MTYKLTYFDAPGRGEPIRLLFALAGQKFEDVRIKHEEFPGLKPNLPWGQLPILQVGDKTIAQTGTIMRFLARRFNVAGNDEFAIAKCEELVDACIDLQAGWIQFLFLEPDETKKAQLKKTFADETLPRYLAKFEKIQASNSGSFMVGSTATWADIWIASGLDQFEKTVAANVLDKYPNLKRMKDTFFAIPNIKSYLEQRS